MPEYEVEIYELHARKIRVSAANRAEAILKVQDGGGTEEVETDFVELIDFRSFAALEEEFPGIISELQKAGSDIDEDTDTMIRSIEEV
jgi:hypothetical protein